MEFKTPVNDNENFKILQIKANCMAEFMISSSAHLTKLLRAA